MAIAQEYKQGTLRLASAPIAAIKGPEGDDDDGLDGLDDLVRGHAAQRHEKRREVETENTPKTMPVLEKFYKSLKMDTRLYYTVRFRKYLDETLTDVLTPDEIETVLQAMLYVTENETLNCKYFGIDLIGERIGIFITKLIQLSYEAGNNDFKLIANNFKRRIGDIGFNLNGNREQFVKIKIDGDITNLCPAASYCEIDLNGHLYYNFIEREFCSEYCIFTFRGEKPIDRVCRTKYSIFKTTNEATLLRLISSALKGENNQIVFINPDGTEEAVLRQMIDSETGIITINKRYHAIVKHELTEDRLQYAYLPTKVLGYYDPTRVVYKKYTVTVSDELTLIPLENL